ncbi:MAG: class I SAM-dependent methyltransferase [Candidatus Saccharimonadales bacterium]
MKKMQYDSVAEKYHAETKADLTANNEEKLKTEMVERPKIENSDGWNVLDLGCGSGIHLEFFARTYPDIHSATGTDVSEEMIRIAKREPTTTKIDYLIADMDSLPLANDYFDFIFSRNALHYSTDLQKTIAEVSRVLKPGGKLFFQVSHPMHNLFLKKSKNYLVKETLHFVIQGGKTEVSHPTFTVEEYVNAITSSNLRIVELKEYDGRTSVVDGYTVPVILALLVTKPL